MHPVWETLSLPQKTDRSFLCVSHHFAIPFVNMYYIYDTAVIDCMSYLELFFIFMLTLSPPLLSRAWILMSADAS